ncbi:hypothetical protein COLO4_00341 [Corchorus olitorius]|uniref:Uncharacterized protein n=1 Tax=Corchorus olitorius TaxID=93759 RepID=A0A1R3L423_9ROSI|nr:hypothetical protein COLO4_00341 [Corchorus olitorius]
MPRIGERKARKARKKKVKLESCPHLHLKDEIINFGAMVGTEAALTQEGPPYVRVKTPIKTYSAC